MAPLQVTVILRVTHGKYSYQHLISGGNGACRRTAATPDEAVVTPRRRCVMGAVSKRRGKANHGWMTVKGKLRGECPFRSRCSVSNQRAGFGEGQVSL